MTNEEFSNEFDVLVNSYSVNRPEGLASTPLEFDEYEKSVFLTKAQESIVSSLYNGNLLGDSFEKTEELKRYLAGLVKTDNIDIFTTESKDKLTSYSYICSIPDDVFYITYEAAISDDDSMGCLKGTTMEVVPITQDEFHRIKDNPFKGPNRKRVLRMDIDTTVIELISKYTLSNYQIRYVSVPKPIILINLPDNLTINGESKETECKLNPAIHRLILEMAVNLAIKSRSSVTK